MLIHTYYIFVPNMQKSHTPGINQRECLEAVGEEQGMMHQIEPELEPELTGQEEAEPNTLSNRSLLAPVFLPCYCILLRYEVIVIG